MSTNPTALAIRRDWLFDLVARKSAPAGPELFIYRELLHCPDQLATALDPGTRGHALFRDVMGLQREAGEGHITIGKELEELRAASENLPAKRATLLTAAILLCA